jgi:hypothetical protein
MQQTRILRVRLGRGRGTKKIHPIEIKLMRKKIAACIKNYRYVSLTLDFLRKDIRGISNVLVYKKKFLIMKNNHAPHKKIHLIPF